VLRELKALGHDVEAYEPRDAWSLQNLLADHGEAGLDPWRAAYPDLSSTVFDPAGDLEPLVADADLVIVHEWNEPALVARIGQLKDIGFGFTLLFHDTHHRAVSEPDAIRAFDLSGYDGVLAFGETLARVYRRWGWGARVFVWHEAADTRHFHPPAEEGERSGLVWIGNWGDGERTAEIEDYLLRPAREARLPLEIFGVRYPEEAKALLGRYGVTYSGWLPNGRAPEVFARHLATVHVPRRFYSTILPGIPTIRVFEALACGIPLVSAPWEDSENLFRPGTDYLTAKDGEEMTAQLTRLKSDPALRRSLVEHGLETIQDRHTCAHRAQELMTVYAQLNPSPSRGEGGTRPRSGWEGEGLNPSSADSIPSPGASRHPLPLREREVTGTTA
jgi:spore maturation protein CgeB